MRLVDSDGLDKYEWLKSHKSDGRRNAKRDERTKSIDAAMIHENPARFFSALPFERCKDCTFCFSPKNDNNTFICAEGMEIRFVGKNDYCSQGERKEE